MRWQFAPLSMALISISSWNPPSGVASCDGPSGVRDDFGRRIGPSQRVGHPTLRRIVRAARVTLWIPQAAGTWRSRGSYPLYPNEMVAIKTSHTLRFSHGGHEKQVVGYVRVSVDNENKVSPEMQAEAIESLLQAEGLGARRHHRRTRQVGRRGQEATGARPGPQDDPQRQGVRAGRVEDRPLLPVGARLRRDPLAELRSTTPTSCRSPRASTRRRHGWAMLQITMVFAQLERARSSERITAWHAYRASRASRRAGRRWATGQDRRHLGDRRRDRAGSSSRRSRFTSRPHDDDRQKFLPSAATPVHAGDRAQLLRSPRLAGIRVVDGVNIPASWPAIIDVDTHEQVIGQAGRYSGGGQAGAGRSGPGNCCRQSPCAADATGR